jgi:fido (protein-threonine AMPylation protein)
LFQEQTVAGRPWYDAYDQHQAEVLALREQYHARCKELGADPKTINEAVRREMVARIVHESNMQEDLYLDAGRTKELAEAVFDDPIGISGPHLDLKAIVSAHREKVIRMMQAGASHEEVAAYNLSRAHEAIKWIAEDTLTRHMMIVFAIFEELAKRVAEFGSEQEKAAIQSNEMLSMSAAFRRDQRPIGSEILLHGGVKTEGDYIKGLLELGSTELTAPIRIEYLHFLHRLTLIGLIPAGKCGAFRKTPVHVSGNHELFFPPPTVVSGMMEEFCKGLYLVTNWAAIRSIEGGGEAIRTYMKSFDRIKESAQLSHRFVRIHPYADGNGRMSRLVMNMVLWQAHPPVYLKADKKGRHRYGWALRKADRGDINPLACLIAISLKQTYKRLLESVTPPMGEQPT